MNVLLLILINWILCYRTASSNKTDARIKFVATSLGHDNNCVPTVTMYSGGRYLCLELLEIRSQDFKNGNCAEFNFENRRHLDGVLKQLSERVARQYCNETGSYSACFKCFNTATEPLWNRHPCTKSKIWRHIPVCLQNYTNPNFNWSRATILNNTLVEIVASPTLQPPYNKCEALFDELQIHHSGNITFPVDMYRYSEDENREMTIMFSLLLNAFEDNNPVGAPINQTKYSFGIECEEMGLSYYWREYFSRLSFSSMTVKGIPMKIKESYRIMRADMCGNITECESCFNRGDVKFLFHARNRIHRVSPILDDYNKTLAIYRNCLPLFNMSQEYVAMMNKSHHGIDKVDVENCSKYTKRAYKLFQDNPSALDTSNITMRSKVILDAVAFNTYSYFGYSVRHKDTKDCSVIGNGQIMCYAYFAIYLKQLLEFVRTEAEEDDVINEFSYNLSNCDAF